MKSTARKWSLEKTLYISTMLALKETARLYPLSIALEKIRKKEQDVLERLEGKQGFLTKSDLMVKLEAIRVFKKEYGIA
jgi:hypothetical protein